MRSSDIVPSAIEHIVAQFKEKKHDKHVCVAIATHVAKMLLTGEAMETVKESKKNMDEENAIKNILGIEEPDEVAFDSAQDMLDSLADVESGGVFVVATGDDDHVYNIIKFGDAIYLIDADQDVYKQIKSLEDFWVEQAQRPERTSSTLFSSVPSQEKYNYADVSEGEIRVYPVGMMHEKWLEKSIAPKIARD